MLYLDLPGVGPIPIFQKANEAGIFSPSDLALLQRAFDRTAVPGETEDAREKRASRVLANFLAGITDEAELIALSRRPLSR